MKTIKSFLVLCMIVVSTAIFAQPQGAQGQRPQGPPALPNDTQIEKMVVDLGKEIELDRDQKVKVLSLYKAHFAQVKQKTAGNKRPDRNEMEALKAGFEKQVKATLTKSQVKKYEAFIKKQKPGRP